MPQFRLFLFLFINTLVKSQYTNQNTKAPYYVYGGSGYNNPNFYSPYNNPSANLANNLPYYYGSGRSNGQYNQGNYPYYPHYNTSPTLNNIITRYYPANNPSTNQNVQTSQQQGLASMDSTTYTTMSPNSVIGLSSGTNQPWINNEYQQPSFYDSQNDQELNCEMDLQKKVSLCGQELISYNMVYETPNIEQFVPIPFKFQSRDSLALLCSSHLRFRQCVAGDTGIGADFTRNPCFLYGKISGPFAVADTLLNYTCGRGYDTTYINWDCYQSVKSNPQLMQCQAATQFVSNAAANGFAASQTAICSSIQRYFDCIKAPIRSFCGNQAFENVAQGIGQAVLIRNPQCSLLISQAVMPNSPIFLLSFATFLTMIIFK